MSKNLSKKEVQKEGVAQNDSLKFSIITVCRNSETTLENAIKSVINQNYTNVEYIIIDGQSQDASVSIIKDYSDYIAHFVSEPDNGIYDALNKGIALASGDIIGFLHSDDQYYNLDVLSKVAKTIMSYHMEEVDAVYGDLVYVSKKSPNRVVRYWRGGRYSIGALHRGWMPPHPTFFMRRICYEKFGNFSLGYRIASDYESMIRYFYHYKIKAQYIPDVLIRMNVGGISNRSLLNIVQKMREDYSVLRRYDVGGLFTLLAKNLRKLGQFMTYGVD